MRSELSIHRAPRAVRDGAASPSTRALPVARMRLERQSDYRGRRRAGGGMNDSPSVRAENAAQLALMLGVGSVAACASWYHVVDLAEQNGPRSHQHRARARRRRPRSELAPARHPAHGRRPPRPAAAVPANGRTDVVTAQRPAGRRPSTAASRGRRCPVSTIAGTRTGRPVTMLRRQAATTSWYEFVCSYVDMKRPNGEWRRPR